MVASVVAVIVVVGGVGVVVAGVGHCRCRCCSTISKLCRVDSVKQIAVVGCCFYTSFNLRCHRRSQRFLASFDDFSALQWPAVVTEKLSRN